MKTAAKIIRDGNTDVKLTAKQIKNFWAKVNKTKSCWVWTGVKNNCQYGRVRIYPKYKLAHRISWMLRKGGIPEKLLVLHKCDNPSCVKPSHLFLGTNKDNSEDQIAKGRSKTNKQRGDYHYSRRNPELMTRGEEHGSTKLETIQVLEIRSLYSSGNHLQKDLAKKYGVSQNQISRITRRLDWQHI